MKPKAEKKSGEVWQGDCLELMKNIPNGSIDAVIADPPYGTTACKWDTVIPFEPMWEQLKRVIKPNGAIVLFGSQPFASALVMSNPRMFKYEWVWEKSHPTGLFSAKYQPMKYHENIVVFGKGKAKYNPQMWNGNKNHRPETKIYTTSHYGNDTVFTGDKLNGIKYPKSLLKLDSENRVGLLHPTQKPVALMEYLIKTYTNEGETVLDFTAGSGTTGVACQNLNRNFILIEKELKYVEIIKQRLAL